MDMENFFKQPEKLKILVVYDVDIECVHLLTEKFVPLPTGHGFDCIMCVGPFDSRNDCDAMSLSEMSSVLAALENIVCRVIYLPAEIDLPQTLTEQLHLTPNSVNIFARRVTLIQGLFVSGYTEVSDSLNTAESEGEDGGSRMVGADIDNIINAGHQQYVAAASATTPAAANILSSSGIFILNYAFAHTLNQFLFHKTDVLNNAGISICVVPSKGDIQSLPAKIGDLNIISVPSLRQDRRYVVANLSFEGGTWGLQSFECETL